jgi:hypothetical protein
MPRRPSSTTAFVCAFIGTALSRPAPATRAITSISARGVVRGPSRPMIALAMGVPVAIGGNPAAMRTPFNASLDSFGANDTKKSLQE